MQFQSTVGRRLPVYHEIRSVGQKLRAGGGCSQQSHSLAQTLVSLVHMAPDDRTHLAMAVEGLKELGRVFQADPIEPAAVHSDRMVMQTNHAMPVTRGGQRLIQGLQSCGAQATAGGAGDAAVEQYNAPRAEISVAIDSERGAIQLAAHDGWVIVVAGQAQHRHSEGGEQPAEMRVAGRVVLHEVAGNQYGIGRPRVRLRMGKRRRERGQCSYPTQGFRLAPVKVRVGKLNQSHYAFVHRMPAAPVAKKNHC